MQIAKVVPKVKTSGEGIFDYAIAPEILPEIKIGILVEVPFHGRNIEAIVIDIKRSSKIDVLKSINKIIDPNPVVDEIHIEVAKWMSDYYLAPLGQTLFENIVPPAIRTISRLNNAPQFNNTFTARAKNVSSKVFLAVGDFSFRMKVYQKAIEKTLTKNKSVIILVPDISLIKYFDIKNPIILHANLTKTQRWLAWNNIRTNDKTIVIGSQGALFAPVNNLGLIIIDQEENETYKSDRAPRFHAVTTAKKLAIFSGASLILGSLSPRISTYFDAIENKYRILKNQSRIIPEISIVDMNLQKGILSHPLQERIKTTLSEQKKTLLILNRKGEGTKFSCSDCGWIAKCEKCGLPLSYQGKDLRCNNCEKNIPIPLECQKCQSVHLRPLGVGIKRLAKFVKDFFPSSRIITIDKDTTPSSGQWDIAVATNFALKSNLPDISLVGIIDADQGLNFPEYLSSEKTFQNLYKFLKIGLRGILQTHLPDNPTLSALAQLNYEKFFLSEIAKRKKYNFPPFTRLIRLLYLSSDIKVAQEASQRVFDLIKSSDKNSDIIGPSAPFINKIRGKFRYQIIIKSKTINDDMVTLLRNLPKNWTVDVDPVDLL